MGKDGDVIILRKKVRGLDDKVLSRFAMRAGSAAGLSGKVNVLVTNSRELQSLNRRFRQKDTPTDVLSFPAENGSAHGLAGEIAISAEIAAVNGRRLGHSIEEEIKILLLHGVLHLAGFDHEQDQGIMARKEADLRRAFKLPVALIERQGKVGKIKTKRRKKSRGTQ